MRPCISFVLARIGFRRALFWACASASAMLAGFTQFRVSSPVRLARGLHLLFGTHPLGDIFQRRGTVAGRHRSCDMGRSNSVALFAQRISMSFGISFAAASLSLSSAGRGLEQRDFATAFLLASGLTLIAAFAMLRLRDHDGHEVSGFGAGA